MSSSDDVTKAFDQLLTPGGADVDPLRMMAGLMAGRTHLHSVFLAPFTPGFTAARERYLADGSGPLIQVAEELGRQGAPDPAAAARGMLSAAQGMCVVVIAQDHGVATIPQLFFGALDQVMRDQMVTACGQDFPDLEAVGQALATLADRLQRNRWPALVAGPALGPDLGTYWLGLAAATLDGLDTAFAGGGRERLVDLAWWISQGILVTRAQQRIDADELELLVRIQLLAGDAVAAGQGLDALIRSDDPDEESVIELLSGFVDGALRAGQALPAAAWLEGVYEAWNEHLGGLYDLPLALVRLHAGAGQGPDALVPAARRLWQANRKAARNDLTKEPLWLVLADPGELLDTAKTAERIGRSTSFVAKRLEARTMPWSRSGDQVRIPVQALAGWQAVMQEFGLLE